MSTKSGIRARSFITKTKTTILMIRGLKSTNKKTRAKDGKSRSEHTKSIKSNMAIQNKRSQKVTKKVTKIKVSKSNIAQSMRDSLAAIIMRFWVSQKMPLIKRLI